MAYFLTTPLYPLHTDVGASFGTFTTRQDVSPLPLPVARAGQLFEGAKLLIKANGEFSTTGTPNLTMGLYIGTSAASITTVLAESSVIVTGSGAAAWPWAMEWMGTIVAIGTAGSIVGSGYLDLGTSLTAHTSTPIPITQALRTVAIDTTIDRAFGVCATWGTSSGSNTVRTNNLSVSLLT